MQANLFPKRILDDLGGLAGITGARTVRADDGLLYVSKDEAITNPPAPTVRASEYFWLSLARIVGLTCAVPEILERADGRQLLGVRREHNAVGKDHATCLTALQSGVVHDAGRHLSRIFVFDLFCANWDRHPGNYLVLDEGGAKVVFAIDFSHVVTVPSSALGDPIVVLACVTRAFFPIVIAPYGADQGAAVELIDRLAAVKLHHIEAILTNIPIEWLSDLQKDEVRSWWGDGRSAARLDLIKQGVLNGVLM